MGEPVIFDILHTNGQSTNALNGQFIHSQLLIDCLLRLKANGNEKNEFVLYCEQYNLMSPKIREQFQKEYCADQALWWYTTDTNLFDSLNSALRNQDIDLLFHLRFFIRDIGEKLEKNKCKSCVRVYRGQKMSHDEIERLKDSTGQLISVNSFFSTSLDRETAKFYCDSSSPSSGFVKVIFEIKADGNLNNVKPFADISKKSQFASEEERLFMIGSIFRLKKIFRNNNQVWIIKMELCSNDDNELRTLFECMKNKYGSRETNLFIFGNVLRKIGKVDGAQKYYERFLNETSNDHLKIADCYHSLGIVTREKGDYDLSLKWLNKALTLDKESRPHLNHSNVAQTYNSMGISYWEKHDYQQALEFFNRALMIFNRILDGNPRESARCYRNIGAIYEVKNNYRKALTYYQKALLIRQSCLLKNDSDIGHSHSSIGNIHLLLSHLDLAVQSYKLALQIYNESCAYNDPDIAVVYKNMGLVYEKKGDAQTARLYFHKARDIYKAIYPDTHQYIIQIDKNISSVSSEQK